MNYKSYKPNKRLKRGNIVKKQKQTKESIEQKNEITLFGNDLRLQLLQKKQKGLKRYIKRRKMEFLVELEKYGLAKEEESEIIDFKDKKLPLMELTERLFEPLINVYGVSPEYSSENIGMLFEFFRECINEINKTQLYVPQKEDFCSLCGFSTQKFSQLKNTGSADMREICCRIEDYLAKITTQAGLTRQASESMSIFTLKSSYGRRDNDPVSVTNYTQNNTVITDEELRKKLEKISNS